MLEKYFSLEGIKWLKECDDLYLKCLKLVQVLFADKVDKGGKPYVGHLVRVSYKVDTLEEKCAALLHDTLEDIPQMTEDVLRYLEIPDEVIEMVKIVTRKQDEDYNQFIDRIISSNNIGALRVKYADMSDNADLKRLINLDKETAERLTNKYKLNLRRIEDTLKEREDYNDKF